MDSWQPPFHCTNCGKAPAAGMAYRCPDCGGVYDLAADPQYPSREGQDASRRGFWRYRSSLPLRAEAEVISLGEGDTPLLKVDVNGRDVYFKCEYLNPTGSFKDRGAALLVSALAAEGITQVVEDSSGNAGAALAAYAARAGMRARIFAPAYASGPKRAQIEAYGAELVPVAGPRSAAAEAALAEAAQGTPYASHVYQPHVLAANATIAFEIFEQLGRAPGCVVAPVGQGTLLAGLSYGFRALANAGAIDAPPAMIGVQAQACAPVWAVFRAGSAGLTRSVEGETIAEGIRIAQPVRGDAVLRAVDASGGTMVAVQEAAILAGRDALARCGLYVEPTSAVVWPALRTALEFGHGPVVAVLTGSGYKST